MHSGGDRIVTDARFLEQAFLAKSSFQSLGAWLVTLAIVNVFAIDCLTPVDMAIPFLYVLILWVALLWASAFQAFAIAAASSVLTVAGLFLSPEGDLQTGLTNPTIALFALWFLASSGIAYRKAVGTLYRRERELTDFFANAPVGIHWVGPDGKILRANQEELDLLGYTKEEYVGRNVIEFHVDRKVAENLLAKLNANVPLKECAARLRHKDGSIRNVLISCNSYLEDGRFIHSRRFTQDITDRVRAEFAESESSQLVAANARLVEETTGRKLAGQALQDSEQQRSLALDDRERLSRDLHDHVIQAIYAIGMQLETCQRRLRGGSKETATQLTRAVGGLNAVIRHVRQYISRSEPPILSERQLRAALAKLVSAVGATSTLRFRLKLDPLVATRLTPQQAEQILHIAREAISNALQHSHAKHAELSLHGTDAGVHLEIRDDGVGFDPGAAGRDAGGLRNMQSRARQIGRQLEIRSSPGQGTTISLQIPNENTSHDI